MSEILNKLMKRKFIAPSKESLMEKIMGIEESLSRYEKSGLDDDQKHMFEICRSYIQRAKEFMMRKPSHPHLIWNLLHRADEHLIFLMSRDELSARALDIRTTFDLTITEKKVREDVLGEKGKLTTAIKNIHDTSKNLEASRYLIRDSLQYLNENVDTNYWILSMNILMSVCSGVLLGLFMVLFFLGNAQCFHSTKECPDLAGFAILGLIGAYISNLITKENFLFVRGGPFWRYLLHNLLSRAILGAFSAVFIIILAKSKWIFSINPILPDGKIQPGLSNVLSINVNPDSINYVHIVLAIASGFAGEKLLRNMFDRVLKRLEEKAEKTKGVKRGSD